MVLAITANGKMVTNQVKASSSNRMALCMKVTGSKISLMVRAEKSIMMVKSTTAFGKTISIMDMVSNIVPFLLQTRVVLLGVYIWPDGRRYEGNYFKNKKSGHGIFYWPNGCKYEG